MFLNLPLCFPTHTFNSEHVFQLCHKSTGISESHFIHIMEGKVQRKREIAGNITQITATSSNF